MTWVKRLLRGTTVWALAREGGELDAGPDGRVDVKYKLDDAAKVYRAAARNLEPAGPGGEDAAPKPAVARADAIIVYTDGACTGRARPCGRPRPSAGPAWVRPRRWSGPRSCWPCWRCSNRGSG